MLRSFSISLVLVVATASVAAAQGQPPAPQSGYELTTYVYKKVGNLEIKADVLSREKATSTRPVVVWIHGGALINGYRTGLPRWMLEEFLPRGYAIVSIDYRLAPESKLPAIVDDVVDAFAWIRSDGPKSFGADPERIAVVGGSAGGYLTLVSGYSVFPKPRALVSLWGYGDLGADWTYEASQFPRHNGDLKTTQAEADRVELGPPVSDSRDRKGDGGAVYQYSRRNGNWALKVTGWDPVGEAAKFQPFMPERNVTADYPPTFLIHGDADTDVPYGCSVRMAEQFKMFGVDHKLISFPGAEHGLPDADREKVAAAYHEAAEFVVKKLEKR